MMSTLRSRVPRGMLTFDEPMSKHTSWRVGGPADQYFQPADVVDLTRYLKELPDDVPVFWFGLGSNLLVRDGGIRGAVIVTHGSGKGVSSLKSGLPVSE